MNALLPQPMPYTVETAMPFNFIGMGTVLFGIGCHWAKTPVSRLVLAWPAIGK